MAKYEKDGVVIEVCSRVQASAFEKSGWKQVKTAEPKEEKKVTEKQSKK